MLNQTQQEIVLAKTRELCETLLAQPPVTDACQRVAAFMGDQEARGIYEETMSRGQALQEKQQRGEVLTPVEISEFEAQRDQLLAHPVAKGFLDAREFMHGLHHQVNDHVSKTLELGRVPTAEDFESGCCGGGGHEGHGDHGCGEGGCGCKH